MLLPRFTSQLIDYNLEKFVTITTQFRRFCYRGLVTNQPTEQTKIIPNNQSIENKNHPTKEIRRKITKTS